MGARPAWVRPRGMDKECVPLCRAMSRVPGIKTHSSCSGHGLGPFVVFFRADKVESLYLVARCLDRRYGCPSKQWQCVVLDNDTVETQPVTFMVSSGTIRGERAYRHAEVIAAGLDKMVDEWLPRFGHMVGLDRSDNSGRLCRT